MNELPVLWTCWHREEHIMIGKGTNIQVNKNNTNVCIDRKYKLLMITQVSL